jgi:hypothetical protein
LAPLGQAMGYNAISASTSSLSFKLNLAVINGILQWKNLWSDQGDTSRISLLSGTVNRGVLNAMHPLLEVIMVRHLEY